MRAKPLFLRIFSVMAAAAALCGGVAATSLEAGEQVSAIARGGRLYDKWYEEMDVAPPEQAHAAYPASGGYANKPKDTWRCKECHGWDYMGKDGAYAKGGHATGIVGVARAFGGDPARVVTVLKDSVHQYGDKLGERELKELALFVTQGLVEMDRYIDRPSKLAKGNAERGEALYNGICAKCHGEDGRGPKEMKVTLGKLAADNPWETLHKVLNGEPSTKMPSLRVLDPQLVLDLITYSATLPKEK